MACQPITGDDACNIHQADRGHVAGQRRPGTHRRRLALGTEDAPLRGRGESCYTYTVIDTIGGGSSEVQKNIIAKRKLDLPKNF